jgi:hypothetical protein
MRNPLTCGAIGGLQYLSLAGGAVMTDDRMQKNDFPLTQEFLAMMLLVRRAGVAVAANALRKAGLIQYHRGHVTILDHGGLQKRSCECYLVTKGEFDRLLGGGLSQLLKPNPD